MAIIIESGFTGISEDLTYPRVGWHQEPGTISGSDSAAGFDAENALTPLTYTAWQPVTSNTNLYITFNSTATPGYLGIAAHTIADSGATITLRKLVGGTWSNWGPGTSSIAPSNNDVILFLLNPQSVDGIGIKVDGGTPKIGVMRAGTVMEWPRLATWTGLPITEGDQYEYDVNLSDTGNWLGRSLKSNGQQFDVSIDHMSEAYRRGDFKDFAAHANTGGATFFIAPRPQGYLDEVAYAWSPEVIRMQREIPNSDVSGNVTLSLVGHKTP